MIGNPILEEGEEQLYEPHLNGLKDKLKPIYEEIKMIGGKIICIITIIDSDLNECEEKSVKI
jgi:hypothetical protein